MREVFYGFLLVMLSVAIGWGARVRYDEHMKQGQRVSVSVPPMPYVERRAITPLTDKNIESILEVLQDTWDEASRTRVATEKLSENLQYISTWIEMENLMKRGSDVREGKGNEQR